MRLRLNKLLALLFLLPALVMAQPIEEIEGEIGPLPSGPADLFVSAIRPDDWIREEATDPNPRPVVQQRFVNFRGTKVRDILSPRREVPFEFTMVFMDDVVEGFLLFRDDFYVRPPQVLLPVGECLAGGRHDRGVDLRRRGIHELDATAEGPAQFVQSRRVEWTAGGDDERSV